jgi:pimeloyl-ACP methyl ester carboxylesterase
MAILASTSSMDALAQEGERGKGSRQPIIIAEQGEFFVGGSSLLTDFAVNCGLARCDPGHVVVDQMYVEYQIPRNRRPGAYPVVLVHGGRHTGAGWGTTPDGREGWDTYFLRRGFPVYVVDQVARGRSGFAGQAALINQAKRHGHASLIPSIFLLSREVAWTAFGFGPEYPVPNPNTQFPVESAESYFKQLVPDFAASREGTEINTKALALLLDRIGPAVVITHSQSASWGFSLSVLRPKLVKGFVLLDSDCLVDPANIPTIHARVPSIMVFEDFENSARREFRLAQLEGCRRVARDINAAGGNARALTLPEVGLRGNTHMMMLDKNNLEIADLLIRWLDRNVQRRPGKS